MIGAAAGSAVAWIVTKKHYQQVASAEIEEIRTLYRQKQAAKEAADRNEEAKRQLLLKEKAEKAVKAVERYSGKAREPYHEMELHNIFKNPVNADDLDLEDEEEDGYLDDDDPYETVVDRSGPSEGASQYPFLITEEEFASEKMVYDKVMLTLYRDGIAVLEDTDEVLDSVEELVGPDILKRDDLERIAEDGILYVRNDSRSSDYGIILADTDFVPEEGGT